MEKRKSYLLILSFISVFIFLLSNISATASFYSIPNKYLNFNDYGNINLGYYCSSSIQGQYCVYNSYRLQFTNPDNNDIIALFAGETSENSYFKIILSTTGGISLYSKNKEINTQIIVYGSDMPYTSQVSTSFRLIISDNQEPIQIASFVPAVIYGNETKTYDLNYFFSNYNSITVSYSDDILQQTVYFEVSKGGYKTCKTGQIKVCLIPSLNDIVLFIQGQNKSYNSSVLGGNIISVKAINNYGDINTGFAINTYPSIPFSYSASPIRNPITFVPANMNFNETKTYDLNLFYKNFSRINVSYAFLYVGLPIHFLIINETGGFLCSSGSVCQTSEGLGNEGGIIDDSLYGGNLTITLYPNFKVEFKSYMQMLNNFPVYFKACNNIGCVSQDAFGNKDIIYVNISGSPPVQIPISLIPLHLNYYETKSFDTHQLFSNYDDIIINWSEGINNYTLTTPISDYNSSIYVDGDIVYQVKLYFNNIVTITSTNIPHDFTLYFIACNSVGCVGGDLPDNFKPHLDIIISNISIIGSFDNLTVSNTFFKSIYNLVLGWFPDSSSLTSSQKVNIVIIFLVITTGLIILFGYSTGGSIMPLIYIAGVVNFFIFLFFLIKGYINPLILFIIGLIVVLLLFLKFIGGKS